MTDDKHEASTAARNLPQPDVLPDVFKMEQDPGRYTNKQVIQNFGCAKQYAKHCRKMAEQS